uniref:Uncharacterized protein n=1 Tax=Vitis vinifera TaxID=29760 RepID=F6HWN9_VITVI
MLPNEVKPCIKYLHEESKKPRK